MSDSGGFMASITSVFNSGIDKAKSMVGGTTQAPVDPSGNPAPPPTDPTFRDKYLTFIPVEVWNYITIAITVLIPFLFAMIVANEMIIYKPTVRAFYFVVTCALCFLYVSFRGIIVVYYILRWFFNKYKKNEGAGGGFFPTIYALLPWTTDPNTVKQFNYLFRYLAIDIGDEPMDKAFESKSFQKKLKDAYYLGEKMVAYFKVLESANPFRGYPEYEKNFANVKKSLFEMHMPALEIDHEKKEYIVRLHRDRKTADGRKTADEFIEITEGSMKPSVNEPSKPTKETLHKVSYNKAENKFTLVTNATEKEDAAKQAALQKEANLKTARGAQLSRSTMNPRAMAMAITPPAKPSAPLTPKMAEAAAAAASF